MCDMDSCTLSWYIKYASVNDFDHGQVTTADLHFYDPVNEVPVQLNINKSRHLNAESVVELDQCTVEQREDIEAEAALYFDFIEEHALTCRLQNALDGSLKYYATFPETESDTVTQAVFSSRSEHHHAVVLECFRSAVHAQDRLDDSYLC